MCLIIASPNAKEIPFNDIRRGFVRNPHGSGFMASKYGQLIVKKGFFNVRDLWEAVKEFNGKVPLVIHHRYGNVGPQNAANCHPWVINDNHALVHNGTMRKYSGFNNSMSDTGHFTELVLKPMFRDYPTLWREPFFTSFVSNGIEHNKLVIMSNTGEVEIYNASAGLWRDGLWYSNNDYRPLPKKRAQVASKVTFKKGGKSVVKQKV